MVGESAALAEAAEVRRVVAAAAAFGGVDAVIRRDDVDLAAADRDVLALQALFGLRDVDDAAGDGEVGLGVDGIVPGVEGERAAFDVDEALVLILIVAGVDGVVPGREVQDAVVDADTVLAGQRLFGGAYFEGAAGHFEVVLRDDAVAVVAGDGQLASAVDGQGRFRPDGGVDLVAGVGVRGRE